MTQSLRAATILHLLILAALSAPSQDHHDRYETIDVLAYRFEIDLNDTSDVIRCMADIEIAFRKDVEQFQLDLASAGKENKGMKVQQITEDGLELSFKHQDDLLTLNIPKTQPGIKRIYRIIYSGVPGDGLIISLNKFGDRTFFGDNWPNRGHHWLPLVDHPSDKAIVEFIVSAPDHYGVVAVGELVLKKGKTDHITLAHYSSSLLQAHGNWC